MPVLPKRLPPFVLAIRRDLLVVPYPKSSKNTQITTYSEQRRRTPVWLKGQTARDVCCVWLFFVRCLPQITCYSEKRRKVLEPRWRNGRTRGTLGGVLANTAEQYILVLVRPAHLVNKVCGGFETLRGYRRTPSRCWCLGWVLGAMC